MMMNILWSSMLFADDHTFFIRALLAASGGLVASFLIDNRVRKYAGEWHRVDDDDVPPDNDTTDEPVGDESSSHHEYGEDDVNERATDAATDELAQAARSAMGQRWLLEGGGPFRTAMIAVVTTAVFAVLGWRYAEWWQLAIVCGYAGVLIACAATDIIAHRIPDVFTYPAIAAAVVVSVVAPGASVDETLLGGLIFGGVFFAMALLPQGGFGDVKLGLFVGLALGLQFAIPALLTATIFGGVGATLILVGSRLRARHTPIPYGPYIAFGGLAVMILGGTAFTTV